MLHVLHIPNLSPVEINEAGAFVLLPGSGGPRSMVSRKLAKDADLCDRAYLEILASRDFYGPPLGDLQLPQKSRIL